MANLGGSNKLLGATATADLLDVPVQTLYRNWRTWGLKGYRVGQKLKFRERDVQGWIERQVA
jgi:excisionase family DNA binding protein